MVPDVAAPLAVVCHDAGAAGHVFAWLADDPRELRVVAEGPAADLWARRFPGRATVASVEEALAGASALLSGTGWASDLEHRARLVARERGVRSIAVLDHWVNYAMRFERHGQSVFPDEIWVTDEYALAEARRCFPRQSVRLQPNAYLEHVLSAIGPPALAGDDVLYVLEPVRDNWGRDTPGEFQALDYFVARRSALGLPSGSVLRVRPHPSDPPGKYDGWLARQHSVPVVLDDAPTLAAAVSRCRWVAGCESYALIVALAAGRSVVCTLPPWAPPARLPPGKLIHLRTIPDPR